MVRSGKLPSVKQDAFQLIFVNVSAKNLVTPIFLRTFTCVIKKRKLLTKTTRAMEKILDFIKELVVTNPTILIGELVGNVSKEFGITKKDASVFVMSAAMTMAMADVMRGDRKV